MAKQESNRILKIKALFGFMPQPQSSQATGLRKFRTAHQLIQVCAIPGGRHSRMIPSPSPCICVVLSRLAFCEVAWQALTTPGVGELEEVDMRGKTVLITGATSGLGLWQAEAGLRRNSIASCYEVSSYYHAVPSCAGACKMERVLGVASSFPSVPRDRCRTFRRDAQQ